MQIHYSSLKFCDKHDEDTTIIVNKYFIRARGFTAWEIITAAKNHQIFEEDTVLSNHRDYLKSQVIKLERASLSRRNGASIKRADEQGYCSWQILSRKKTAA
jgi:hypothetical protein